MEIQKKMILCTAAVFLAVLLIQFMIPTDPVSEDVTFKIGSGNDVSGYLMKRVLEQSGEDGVLVKEDLSAQGYAFKDC